MNTLRAWVSRLEVSPYLRVLPALVFALLMTGLQMHYGVRHAADSVRYLGGAENLISGAPFQEKQTSYLGYVVLVAGCKATGIGSNGVVALQILVGLVAVGVLFALGRLLAGDWGGFAAAMLVAANADILQYHSYILTDSFYISFVSIVTFVAYDAACTRRARSYVLCTVLLFVAAFIRPNGWALFPAIGVFWVACSVSSRLAAAGVAAGIALLFLLMAFLAAPFRRGIEAEGPVTMLYRGEVLWSNPSKRLAMPPTDEPTPPGFGSAAVYALRHPFAVARLMAARVGTSLIHARDSYSAKHNALIYLFLPPVYLLAIAGVILRRSHRLVRLMLCVMAAHFGTIALTFADQDGRFLLYSFPLICVLASVPIGQGLQIVTGRPEASGPIPCGGETVASVGGLAPDCGPCSTQDE